MIIMTLFVSTARSSQQIARSGNPRNKIKGRVPDNNRNYAMVRQASDREYESEQRCSKNAAAALIRVRQSEEHGRKDRNQSHVPAGACQSTHGKSSKDKF